MNKSELKSKEALEISRSKLELSVKKENEAEQKLRQAYAETENAKRVEEKGRKDSQEGYKAKERVRQIERTTERSKLTYKSLFIGNSIFTLVLAFFVAFSKHEVLVDMLKWFPLRFNNLKSFVLWIVKLYLAAIQLIQGKWEFNAIWNYLIVTIIIIVIGIGSFFIVKFLLHKFKEFIRDIRGQYKDGLFKNIVSGNIILAMLFSCLFFSDPIKQVLPFNIFSAWLIFSFVGIVIWHRHEIVAIIKGQ